MPSPRGPPSGGGPPGETKGGVGDAASGAVGAAVGLAVLSAAAEGAAGVGVAGGVAGVSEVVWARRARLIARSVRAAGAAGGGDFSWACRVPKLSSRVARAKREWSMGKGMEVAVGAGLGLA